MPTSQSLYEFVTKVLNPLIKNKSVHCCEMFAIHYVCYWELSRYQSFILKCKPQILSVKPNSKYFSTIIPFLLLPCSIQSTILFHAVGVWHKNYDTENSTDLLCIMLLNPVSNINSKSKERKRNIQKIHPF